MQSVDHMLCAMAVEQDTETYTMPRDPFLVVEPTL